MNMKNLQSVQPIIPYSEPLQQVGQDFVPAQRSHILVSPAVYDALFYSNTEVVFVHE